MMRRWGRRFSARRGTPQVRDGERDTLDAAIGAMPAEELRVFLREYVARLDEPERTTLADALIERAARGSSGWRPSAPSTSIVRHVERFVEAALQVGQADPNDVDAYLRQADRAYLAGDLATARAVYECLLPAIGGGEIHLGEHEMIDEVLTVAVSDCAARCLVALYCTTTLSQRAAALFTAVESLEGISDLGEPLAAMEGVATGPLPDLSEFLPLWVARLEREKSADGEWESPRDQRLREAVERSEGVAGLERLARETRRPAVLRAWCTALMVRGQWAEALGACDAAATLVTAVHWQGDFLDGAALAAQRDSRDDVADRLESAWRAPPSLARLLRWLCGGPPSPSLLKQRARASLKRCPTDSRLLRGVLKLFAGDVQAAAAVLAAAPGLDWSRDEHPGHVLFASLSWLLAGAPAHTLRAALATVIQQPPVTDLAPDEAGEGATRGAPPQLSTPCLLDLLQGAQLALTSETRTDVVRALRAAATTRVRSVLREKRRRQYDHAAALVACCVEVEAAAGNAASGARWSAALQQRTSRYPAFQGALRGALRRATR
jgi:hypothetical protein